MAMAEVTVMGAGIFGLSVAYACARAGARVQVIDPHGVGAGSSGGLVGALSPHTPENWNPKKAFQLESLLMAEGYWAAIADLTGLSAGYGRVGRLQAIDTPRALELAQARAGGAATLWQGRAEWNVVPAGQFAGWAPEAATGYLIHDTLSARMHPRRACAALAAAIRELGGRIDTDATPRGSVVWATGHRGLLELSKALAKPVGNGVKGQALLLDHDAAGAPQIYADGLHIIPHADGTVAIGSTSERDFDAPDTTDAQLDALLVRAARILPALQGAQVLERWAGVRPRAKSRAPMLGAWPGRPGHFIANGGFKIGFGIAPKVGAVMADLVLQGVDAIPDGFRVEDNL
ncbi:NAD(P)/FAD-dependent oxidoreductase [Actibacterium ureilyticum]|uniref:NAD(P)/FAD-dependent oxidoreductase n=1 Tax=Actibacterium ureilyticum TaxID=1590614 RepID=UPI000BAABFF9|nr:FAD-dependent oxidoreductase [Actibacterium ureilyticum]